MYLESVKAPDAIKETIPEVKLIVTLRNPAILAYSDFIMSVKWGHRKIKDLNFKKLGAHEINIGFYSKLLAKYYDLFPHHKIKIMIFEEWSKSIDDSLSDLFKFLGVPQHFLPNKQQVRNEKSFPKNVSLHYRLLVILIRQIIIPK